MLKILISSYACCPDMGSEPGMGWNWIIHLARYCEVYVISEGEFRTKVEVRMKELGCKPTAPPIVDGVESSGWCLSPKEGDGTGMNLFFFWNPVSDRVRKMCWNQGDWRFYLAYHKWQKKTRQIAEKICDAEKIDILHQLNMTGFREPGLLYVVSEKYNIPLVWGPMVAKAPFPIRYTDGASCFMKMFCSLKHMVSELQLRFSPGVKKMLKRASAVVCASSDTMNQLKRFYDYPFVCINETGCNITDSPSRLVNHLPFTVLWVGKFDFRKQLPLAIKSIAAVDRNVVMHVVGDGNKEHYQPLVDSLKIEKRIVWHGFVPHDEVQRMMRKAQMLLFTSVDEGTPHVVLEAISNSLPVLCFDTCGQGDCVTDEIGIKIPLNNPGQSVKDIADKINYLYDYPEELKRMSDNCNRLSHELSWDSKARRMVEIYRRCLY